MWRNGLSANATPLLSLTQTRHRGVDACVRCYAFGTSTVRDQNHRHRLRGDRRDDRVRLGGQEALDEIAVSEQQRNASKARIKWMFTIEKLAPNCRTPFPGTNQKNHNHRAAAVLGLHGSACTVWRKVKMVHSVSSSSRPVQLGMPLSGRPCATVKWNTLDMFSP